MTQQTRLASRFELPNMERHLAVADALMDLLKDDPAAFPAWIEDGGRLYAQAIAQRVVTNLGKRGWLVERRPPGDRPLCAECGRTGYYVDMGAGMMRLVGHLDQRIKHTFVLDEAKEAIR